MRQLELENDIPRVVAMVLIVGSPDSPTSREKAPVINELRATAGRSLRELADSLRISKSSYEYQRAALVRSDRHAALRTRVRDVFEAASGSRGYRHVTHEPRSGDDPARVSEKVVRALMREEGLVVAYARRRSRCSSYRGEISEAPENLVGRRFAADAPNRLWLTDITEFDLPGGKVYLSSIVDCFDGGLLEWSIGTSPDARLANDSLEAAGGTLVGDERPVIHSDRGATTDDPAGLGSARGTAWSGRCRGRAARPTTRRWGVLREAQEQVLSPPGLVGGDDTRVLPHARRLPEVLQRAEAEGEAGLAELDAVP